MMKVVMGQLERRKEGKSPVHTMKGSLIVFFVSMFSGDSGGSVGLNNYQPPSAGLIPKSLFFQ